MSKQLEIRGTWKQRLVGKLIIFFIRSLGATLRCRLDDPHGVAQTTKPVIWIFWHNCLIAASLNKVLFSGRSPASALASASKDGAVIESVISSFGVKTVRGSSSRRGVAALIALKKALKAGEQLFLTPDGPRGPRYHLQPGVIKLAQSSGVPIIPVRVTYSSSWRVKSWDRFHIPKPFSKITVHLDNELNVPAKLDENTFESYRGKVEGVLRQGVDDLPDQPQIS